MVGGGSSDGRAEEQPQEAEGGLSFPSKVESSASSFVKRYSTRQSVLARTRAQISALDEPVSLAQASSSTAAPPRDPLPRGSEDDLPRLFQSAPTLDTKDGKASKSGDGRRALTPEEELQHLEQAPWHIMFYDYMCCASSSGRRKTAGKFGK
eukprot:TRINITY_DN101549_c0_g1_i1.p1 TRINITY_DN101549_c0_g1~~TRINITY_DN101549_c0_g1_i1.p1  ORF type:complete len:152 (-),score=39.64 TRINITY_DN101549_c0_g1_i1:165-620(-)